MAKITVVGSLNMDVVATMDRFPAPGETVSGKTVAFYPGGKGANQCVAVARLGGDVEMCGMLGQDANGDILRGILAAEGIIHENVFASETPTGVAQILINAAGQNEICVIPAANHAFGLEEVGRIDRVLAETEMLVLQYELRRDVTEELIRRAHAHGTRILFNPAPAAPIDPAVLSLVDYLTPNETELALLTGCPADSAEAAIAAARRLLLTGVGHVIVTMGGQGALLVDAENTILVPGYRAREVVDTVAAGDSFCGALAVALTEGKALFDAIRFANAMGALTVSRKGAIPSLHTRAEVEAFIKENA